MATYCLAALSSSSWVSNNKTITPAPETVKQLVSLPSFRHSFSFRYATRCSPLSHSYKDKQRKVRVPLALSIVNGAEIEEEIDLDQERQEEVIAKGTEKIRRPCELYVCNLPRSYGITQLLEMFQPFGTIISVEVSRNAENNESRGCGYVTMSSVNTAKNAINGLDGSDVSGRELRVRFSVDMKSDKRNSSVLNSTPKKILMYESPYKVYVGNLSWTTKPDEIRNHFTRFGIVVSVRVLHDRKAGKGRVFAFLSYSSPAERDAALSLDGTDFCGRTIIVREGIERTEP